MMAETKEESILAKIGAFAVLMLFLPPLVCLMDGLGTLIHQVADWLKTGVWEPRDFWSGVHNWFLTDRPSFEWVIPDRLLNWMLDGPRSIWMLLWSALLFVAEIAILIISLTCLEKGWKRWRARYERPLITMSRKTKIAVAITVAWLLGFPTVVAFLAHDADVWDDMLGVAGLLAFWGWTLTGVVKNYRDKVKEGA